MTTPTLTTYVVELHTPAGRWLLDVPTGQGPDAAARRARIAVATQMPTTPLDDITIGRVATITEWETNR